MMVFIDFCVLVQCIGDVYILHHIVCISIYMTLSHCFDISVVLFQYIFWNHVLHYQLINILGACTLMYYCSP